VHALTPPLHDSGVKTKGLRDFAHPARVRRLPGLVPGRVLQSAAARPCAQVLLELHRLRGQLAGQAPYRHAIGFAALSCPEFPGGVGGLALARAPLASTVKTAS